MTTSPDGPYASVEPQDVIVIMTDQHRADLCGREGFGVDCTPTLDRLAAQGRWFDRAYTVAPICTPARISMLTGRYPSAHGVRENSGADAVCRGPDLFDLARAAGFRTALIGKNHSHLTPDRVDEFYEFGHFGRRPPERESGPAKAFDDWLRDLGPSTATEATPHAVESQVPARIVDRAISWLDDGAAERSMLWLSIPEPHVPYQLPEPYFSDYSPDRIPAPATDRTSRTHESPGWRYVYQLAELVDEAKPDVLARARASYVGMLRLIDDQVRRLIRHLEDAGRLDRTLIVFVADHGDFAGEYGLMRKGPELPEVLVRIPMFFTGPGVRSSTQPSPAHVSIVDILPTLCELLHWPIPDGVQGRSLAPILRDEPYPSSEFDSVYVEQGYGGLPYDHGEGIPVARSNLERGADTLSEVTQGGSMRAVRSGRWKLQADLCGRFSLFDLATDPYELVDLYQADGHERARRRMLELLSSWLIRSADPLPIPDRGRPRKRHPRNYHWQTGPGSALGSGRGSGNV